MAFTNDLRRTASPPDTTAGVSMVRTDEQPFRERSVRLRHGVGGKPLVDSLAEAGRNWGTGTRFPREPGRVFGPSAAMSDSRGFAT